MFRLAFWRNRTVGRTVSGLFDIKTELPLTSNRKTEPIDGHTNDPRISMNMPSPFFLDPVQQF